jgi:hypothetical protein
LGASQGLRLVRIQFNTPWALTVAIERDPMTVTKYMYAEFGPCIIATNALAGSI